MDSKQKILELEQDIQNIITDFEIDTNLNVEGLSIEVITEKHPKFNIGKYKHTKAIEFIESEDINFKYKLNVKATVSILEDKIR